MRQIGDVIAEIKGLIPPGNEEIISKLDAVYRNAGYTPPETMGERWQELSVIVSELVGRPPLDTNTELWKLQIVATLTVTDLESVKENFLKKI